jgi:hypothetical protein
VVGNRSELQQAVPADRRGSVMATRAVIAESLVIVGAGLGGILTGVIGGRVTYLVVAVGMLVLGLLIWTRGARLRRPSLPSAPGGFSAPAGELSAEVS